MITKKHQHKIGSDGTCLYCPMSFTEYIDELEKQELGFIQTIGRLKQEVSELRAHIDKLSQWRSEDKDKRDKRIAALEAENQRLLGLLNKMSRLMDSALAGTVLISGGE